MNTAGQVNSYDEDLFTFLYTVSLLGGCFNNLLSFEFVRTLLAKTEDLTFLLSQILYSQNVLHSANVTGY